MRLFPAVTGVAQTALSAVSQVANLRGRGVERTLHVSGRLSCYRRLRRLATCDTADMAVCATHRWLTARKNRTRRPGIGPAADLHRQRRPDAPRSSRIGPLPPQKPGTFDPGKSDFAPVGPIISGQEFQPCSLEMLPRGAFPEPSATEMDRVPLENLKPCLQSSGKSHRKTTLVVGRAR